jgi:asparagine synthase (glutamine-hydrolysing)
MARLLAVLGGRDPGDLLARTGAARLPGAPPGVALGRLEHTSACANIGPFHATTAGRALISVGEVTLFNRRELLAALTEPVPADISDGALLTCLYGQLGPAAFAQARGMFALVIADGETLVLARDAVGARTLFHTRVGDAWLVASRLHPLRRVIDRRLDLAAVQAFLTYAYVPGEATLLAGVRELLPGTALTLHPDGRAAAHRFWEPHERITPIAHHAAALRASLERATAEMLPDGPVGVFLSGGIDSSAITALAARLHPAQLRTYAISFGAGLPSELAYSSLVASHCRTDHQILTFDGRQIADHLAEAVALLDSPVGDPLTVPNLLLARAAAADGLRVVLNGEGGDPVLGGPKNLPMLFAELHRPDADPLARARLYLRAYRKCHDDLPHLLTPAALAALQTTPPLEHALVPYFADTHMRSYLNKLLHINLRTKGAHHILTKVERLTGSCNLEGRAPLFDRAFIDLCFTIPPQLKLHGTTEKWIFKNAVRDLLPATIVDRPKSGMRVPVQHWLRGPLRSLAHDLLLSRRARERELLRPEIINQWMNGEAAVWPRQGGKLWLVLTLELWLRSFLDRAD